MDIDMKAPPAELSDVVKEVDWTYNNTDIEDVYKKWDDLVKPKDKITLRGVVTDLLEDVPETEAAMNKKIITLAKKWKTTGLPKKSHLLFVYEDMVAEKRFERERKLEERLVTKAMKSQSGVVSITVLTSPYPRDENGKEQNFTCKYNCYYCPDQPGQPRSYLRDEPAVRRANQNSFDPILQFSDRASVLAQNGHPIDKVELLVIGGTWTNYPHAYQEAFIRDLYYAANTFRIRENLPEKKSLLEEQAINESASCKIIGLTLETRPDTITPEEVTRLREYGCTRLQIGIQHTDDGILSYVNRGHDDMATQEAITLLKNSCFKIDAHLMPNLPGSDPGLDAKMFSTVFQGEAHQVDQIKIYPCEVTPWTLIKKWHDDGKYKPYPEEDLISVLVDAKAIVPPWVRLNRVIRDIPAKYVENGPQENLREVLLRKLSEKGVYCKCIRCREAGDMGGRLMGRENGARDGVAAKLHAEEKLNDTELVVRKYKASGGEEYFISIETHDRSTLYGFCRLRISDGPRPFTDLANSGLIRELHVYGQLIPTAEKDASHAQNLGFGRQLLAEAERIAHTQGLSRTAVIAGVGSRNYYRKLGYFLSSSPGHFMVKELSPSTLLPPPVIKKRAHTDVHQTGRHTDASETGYNLLFRGVQAFVLMCLAIGSIWFLYQKT
eukprot:TRINITY_DN16124_c0_g1_i1.p1 TRINITY_DN16124_c0_g1~~TRINITY_DN16124_c0_g1_i1.p1  ORF type:complete len:683 (+),score=120.85 TRINITY_DN16124_c0_g1_i1:57-2051(+)